MIDKKLVIIILNYNNANDTIACIKSILKQIKDNICIVVVDNCSSDNSFHEIKNYYRGQQLIENERISFIQSNANYGYSKGNNLGLKFALLDETIEYFWILNNDTILKEDCIAKVLEYLKINCNEKEVLGTLLTKYNQQNIIQALGGIYNPIIGKTKLLYPDLPKEKLTKKHIEITLKEANYLIGASLIFSKKFLNEVGLFNEAFFLYSEEVDIIKRSKKFGYKINLIQDAIVYHKEGGTTCVQSSKKQERNPFIEYHNSKSKLIFSKLYYPFFYPITLICVLTNLFVIYRNDIKKAFDISKKLLLNKVY